MELLQDLKYVTVLLSQLEPNVVEIVSSNPQVYILVRFANTFSGGGEGQPSHYESMLSIELCMSVYCLHLSVNILRF